MVGFINKDEFNEQKKKKKEKKKKKKNKEANGDLLNSTWDKSYWASAEFNLMNLIEDWSLNQGRILKINGRIPVEWINGIYRKNRKEQE